MTAEIKNIIDQITARITHTRQRMYREEFMRALLNALSIIILVLSILVMAESLVEFGTSARTFIFYLFFVSSALILLWFVGLPFLHIVKLMPQASDEDIARFIGKKFEKIGDRLENTLDLAKLLQSGDASYSPELVEVSLEHFQHSTSGVNFTDAVSFVRVKNLARRISAITAAFFLVVVVPGSPFGEATVRLWNHQTEFIPASPFTFIVDPGNIDVVKGESIIVKAKIVANSVITAQPAPSEATIVFAQEGVAAAERVVLHSDSTGMFSYAFSSIKNSLTYSLQSENVKSKEYSISVTDRPFIRSLRVVLMPPAYTKLSRQMLDENIGDVLVLAGTRIDWKIIANKELKKLSVVFKDGRDIALTQHGEVYEGSFIARTPLSYYFELEDTKGITNSNIIEYKINIIPDQYPTVEVIAPGRNIDVTQAMQLPMEFKIGDDFGIREMHLAFRLVQSKYEKPEKNYGVIIPVDSLKSPNQVVGYDWDMSVLGLVPEDVVEYYAEVFDNDNINGPKSARSQTFLVRLPSLEEVFADAEQTHDEAIKNVESSLKNAEELKKDVEELSNDMKRNQQMDWQKQKKAEEIAKKYEDLQKKMENVNKQVDEMTQTLQRNNVLSPETLEKYAELQKMMQELNSPEFQQALKRMQQAMQNVSPDQLREAMQQVQFSEEQFRTSIERTMNLLKRIHVEQKVDELVKRSKELQKQQDDVAKASEQMKQNDPQQASELAQKQDEISKQLGEMKKSMNELHSKMEEFPKEMPLDKLDEAQRAANDREMNDAMKKSSQNLRSMQMEQAMTAQQQIQSGMKEMSNQISEMQEQMLNNQMQQTMNTLRKSMQDMLQLSQKQEQLKNQSRNLDPNSQQFRDAAEQQQNVQSDLQTVANGLGELSQKSFVVTPEMGKQIGKAMGQMQQAMSAIEQRNASATSSSQGEAMSSLNKAATLVQNAMQTLQQQGGQGGGGLMQQLRSMAMQQQNINMQTQQMGQQQGMSQQQMQEMGRLARQQEAVKKSLDQLQREAEGSPERNRIMGDLKKISDEMKEVVEQLQQNDASPSTIQQQERILSRLLQAQRSTRERDFEQRRKATAGVAISRKSPSEISLQTQDSQIRRDLQRAMEAGYSKDYLDLIRKYYEALNKTN
ncbi:MAG: hypothetical protein PHP42_05050 [Bacteroidota bacterium]|nr:hypothetical protein [Bacteroidota bacterium]